MQQNKQVAAQNTTEKNANSKKRDMTGERQNTWTKLKLWS